jgi:hypothetical protein
MKNLSLAEAGEKAKSLAYKMTCCEGLRNSALIAKLLAKRLKKELENQKNQK